MQTLSRLGFKGLKDLGLTILETRSQTEDRIEVFMIANGGNRAAQGIRLVNDKGIRKGH